MQQVRRMALARVAPAAAPASHERCRLRRHGNRSMATPRELLRIAGRTKQGLWHKCWLLAGSFDGGCVAHHGYRIPIPHKFGSPRVDDVPRLLLDFASCLLLLLVCAPCPHRHLAFAFLLDLPHLFFVRQGKNSVVVFHAASSIDHRSTVALNADHRRAGERHGAVGADNRHSKLQRPADTSPQRHRVDRTSVAKTVNGDEHKMAHGRSY